MASFSLRTGQQAPMLFATCTAHVIHFVRVAYWAACALHLLCWLVLQCVFQCDRIEWPQLPALSTQANRPRYARPYWCRYENQGK